MCAAGSGSAVSAERDEQGCRTGGIAAGASVRAGGDAQTEGGKAGGGPSGMRPWEECQSWGRNGGGDFLGRR